MTLFLGIDLAWSMKPDKDSSGFCILDENGRIREMGMAGKDEEMIDLAKKHGADFVGIDAPLKVQNEDGARPVEKELAKRGRPAYPANRRFFNKHYGGIRGEKLVERFEKSGYPFVRRTGKGKGVIEVYPNPTIQALLGTIPQYKNLKKEDIRRGINGIWNKLMGKKLPVKINFNGFEDQFKDLEKLSAKDLKKKGDILDSFFCAYVLLLDYKGLSNVEVIGNRREGYILTLINNEKKLTDYTKGE